MNLELFYKDSNQTLLIPLKTGLYFEGDSKQLIEYNNSVFIWVNGTEDYYPLIIAPVNTAELDELYAYSKTKILKNILEYISILNASYKVKIDIHQDYFKNYYGSIHRILDQEPFIPRIELRLRHKQYQMVASHLESLTESESIQLGLFREGFNSNNIFYSFLSFFKIFEYSFKNYKERDKWIEENFNDAKKFWQIHGSRGLGDWDFFTKFVQSKNLTIGQYLYFNCRNAIAHANEGNFINPNEFTDYYEMYYSNEVIKFLAWYFIFNQP
jgi:hypothetical protein